MVYLTIDNHASSPYHNPPRSQVPIWNNPTPMAYGSLAPQTSGQYFYAQSGDIRQMSAVQSAFMKEQMAYMMREMESEFSGDEEEQTARSQSLSADFDRLTIEELASSSSRSALIHGSSSTAIKGDKGSRHTIITGDHIEVDNNVYQSDFDSHKRRNNIIENSFRDGEQEGVWRMHHGMFILCFLNKLFFFLLL